MSILQTELCEQNNSKILSVKIKICFFSIVFNILLLCFFLLQVAGADIFQRAEGLGHLMLYTHTHTHKDWPQLEQYCPPPHTHTAVKPIPYPHPHPSVCCASTGFGWTGTAYTAVLSSAGMAQGFAGPARLIPDALRAASGKVNAVCVCRGGGGCGRLPDGRIQGRWTQKWPSKITCGPGNQRPRKRPNFLIAA